MKSLAFTLLMFVSLSIGMSVSTQDDAKQGRQESDKKIVIPKQDEDSISRRDSMRAKLMYSKNVLEGLTVNDFDLVLDSCKNMLELTEGDSWIAIDSDNYRALTEDFKTGLKKLTAAAKSKNIDATALRFYDLSTRCIDCHNHLRNIDF